MNAEQLDIFTRPEREPQASTDSTGATGLDATATAPSRSDQLTELPGNTWEHIFTPPEAA
jgi:hypothetical protein